jgi:hypothetical protein
MEATWVHQHSSRASAKTNIRLDGSFWSAPERLASAAATSFGGPYRDIGSGHKALSALVLTGVVSHHIAKHLAEALEIDDALLGSLIGATTRQKRDEALRRRVENERAYRDTFRPHLQVQTERTVPSPISVAALLTVARLRIIHLPDEALTANDEARERIIKTIIIDHWRENGGCVPAFGGIMGYVLVLVAGYGGFDFGFPTASPAIGPVRCKRSSG